MLFSIRAALRLTVLLMPLTGAHSAYADSAEATCDVYPAGEDHTKNSGPCVFSQRQGYITIRREDGVVHDLSPVGDTPGNFEDEQGRAVYRQSGLGAAGLIFRFPDESVYVYWKRRETSTDSSTAPYSTDDYDATTLLNCRAEPGAQPQQCAAGILRMEDGASIVVTAPSGDELTINILPDYVNTGFGPSESTFEDYQWTVTVPGAGVFEIPRAAVEGG